MNNCSKCQLECKRNFTERTLKNIKQNIYVGQNGINLIALCCLFTQAETKTIAIVSSHTKLNLVDLHEPLNYTIMANTSKIRVKRQGSGASNE